MCLAGTVYTVAGRPVLGPCLQPWPHALNELAVDEYTLGLFSSFVREKWLLCMPVPVSKA